ncbi:HNH endonuclease [Kineococcus sp. NBC_00420]|uniref:HNH endonuclease domain-containing protein n=1 Tax=unclassified Kineococcus TaxID=2621656 RepID=UPI002E1EE204
MDPLDLGARLAQLLATGRRVSTYKLATLDALVQHCLENPVADDAPLSVPVRDLASRVVEAYWPQVRVFGEHGVLRQIQHTRPGAVSVIDLVTDLRRNSDRRGLSTPAQFRTEEPHQWTATVRKIAITLARQPLFRLQKTGGREPGVAFLYDDSWLSDDVGIGNLDAHDWSIELFPGVATALARVSPMLQPVLQQWWVEDVQRHNSAELEIPDLHAFLFDADRTAVARLAPGLREFQQNRCFYCGRTLTGAVHVDHVLPWSRVAIDGVRNLVLTDPRCNGDKAATLPVLDHVREVLARPEADLVVISAPVRWPVETERVRGAARGLYRSTGAGSPLWRAPGLYDFHDGTAVPL